MANTVGMTDIALVVAAATATSAAGSAMKLFQLATSAITSVVTPPSADPASAMASVNLSIANADMEAKSMISFAGVEALSSVMKASALAHAATDGVGSAIIAAV